MAARAGTAVRWRRRCCGATRGSSSPTSPRARRRGCGWTTSTPAPRAAGAGGLDRTGTPTVDAAVVAYPHDAAAPVVAELRERGRARGRPLGRLPAARPRDVRALVRRAPRARAPRPAVYGLPELHREAIAGAELVANPGCYPTAALLGLAPLARAGLIDDVVIDAKSGVSGAGRARDATRRTSSPPTRTSSPTRSPATATRRRSSRSWRARRDAADRVRPAPRAARPGRARHRLRDATRGGGRAGDALRRRVRRRAVRGAAPTPAGVPTSRDEHLPHLGPRRRAHGPRSIVFAAIDNLWKGDPSQAVQNLNLMFGLPEDEGIVTAFELPLGGAARARHRAAPAGCPPASAPPASPAGSSARRARRRPARLRRAGRRSAARFTRSGVLAAPVLCRERCELDAPARRRGQRRQRERRDRPPRASRSAARDAGRGRDGRRRRRGPGGGRLDRRDRRPARRRPRASSGMARARAAAARRRRRRLRRGDPHDRRVREARRSRSRCRPAPCG